MAPGVLGGLALALALCCDVCSASAVQCTHARDCSYNGVCNATTKLCDCEPQWKGGHCASLNVVPGVKGAGLRSVVNGTRTSTWGGGAVFDGASKKYHMLAAEMLNGCGISVWLSNSQIVHATSDTVDGVYARQDNVLGEESFFSHEPNIVMARDTGQVVVYFTHTFPPVTKKYPCPASKCHAGQTVDCPTTPNEYGRVGDATLPTKMMYTSNISDPTAWSEIIDLDSVSPNPWVDSNLAVYIFPNGSLVGLLRANDDPIDYHVVTAAHWRDVSSYVTGPVHRVATQQFGEDMFVWYDPLTDVVHSLWHYTYNGDDMPLGLHTFSEDGGHRWQAYLDFGPGPGNYPAEWAYDQVALYTDGTNDTFPNGCERPHLIMAEDGRTPLALTNGVRAEGDYSFTLLRPINQK